ncbi:DUF1206 domain-containing protein [Quadrisphaera setariae]|uniref:DUF1206 domain-containing protein n=1 Tax=Quadrisphaera setariae TaxID=2593304 RepID=A0A5C8ZIP1_9ACTN|nr:DUF1206 domain-containing protein [Quadrisphaera setariae]TXR56740.1 DUF1206 domain-containing protein [Quadrisphaera setariae]
MPPASSSTAASGHSGHSGHTGHRGPRAQGSGRSPGADARRGARQARERLEPVARAGFVVSGLLHVLIGALAVRIALGGGSGGSADSSGALGEVARTPFGAFALWAAVVALAALGLWQLLDGALEARAKEAKEAAKGLGQGVVFLALAGTALTFARGGSSSSESSTDDATATLMGSPGGVLLVGAVGLAVVGGGGYLVYKGCSDKVRDDLGGSGPGGRAGRAALWAGRTGYVAKGLALAVVGVLFVVAAVRSDPSQAGGIDAAMRTLVGAPFGVALLVAVGVGFALYGVWCFVRARWGEL